MPRGRNKVWFESSPGGIRGDLNPATIPGGEWLSSNNWLVRNGVGVPRPGYQQRGTQLDGADRIIGIFPLDIGYPPNCDDAVVSTTTSTFYISGVLGSFSSTDITGSWTSTGNHVAFTYYKSGGTTYVVRSSGSNAIDKWDQNAANDFIDATGAPGANDLTVVGPYLIAATSTGIQWNEANDIDSWPAANIASIEPIDFPAAVRSLSNSAAAVYGYKGIYVASLQAAKTAFRLTKISDGPGPAGKPALASGPGKHYWLGYDNLIYSFDGSRVEVVTDAATKFLSSNMSNSVVAYLLYVPRSQPELWLFHYNSSSVAKSGLVINLVTKAAFPLTFQDQITAAAVLGDKAALDYPIEPMLLLGSEPSNLYVMHSELLTDNGTSIPWNFEYGYRPTTGDVDVHGTIDEVSSYWKKTSSSCTVTVSVTPSDSISDDETTYTETIDTSTATSSHPNTFRGKKGKWTKLKFSGTSVVADLEYRGASVSSWARADVT